MTGGYENSTLGSMEITKDHPEIIRRVPGVDTMYASSWGDVFDKDMVPIRHGSTPSGHRQVTVWIYGKSRPMYVHRIIAMTFIPNNNPEKNVVMHLDDLPTNNQVWNLKWGTLSENFSWAYKTARARRIRRKRAAAGLPGVKFFESFDNP